MKKFSPYLILIAFFSQTVFAAPRLIDADGFRNPLHTKTYNLPAITGSSDSLQTLNSTGVVTNKSISGLSNTFTNIPLGSAVTGNLPFANLPSGGSSTTFLRGDGSWGTPTGGQWGQITGTLSNQTDLATALGLAVQKSANLSDLASASTARTNLGLGPLSTLVPTGTASSATFLNGAGAYATALTPGQALTPANNLSDVSSATTSRTNLGLGSLATITPTGTASATTFLRGDGQWIAPTGSVWGNITGTLSNQTDLQTALNATAKTANNLSDLASASTARTNLGLGTLATQSPTGTANSSTFLSGANTYVAISKSNLNINYITDTDAESGTVGAWATYANTASPIPVSGTGGSPTVTWTASNSPTPMIGNYYYLFTHPASNTQGQGASYYFSIDQAFFGKPMQISFQYSLASGTYSGGTGTTDSDLEVYMLDYLGNVVIQPSGFKMDCGAVVGTQCTFYGNFQNTMFGTYRLMIHSATTTTSAFAMKFDNIIVSPYVKTFGVPASDLVSAGVNVITATTTAPTKGTTTNDVVRWGRIGDHARIKGEFKMSAAGSGGSGDYLWQLPSPLQFDPNKTTYFTTAYGGAGSYPIPAGLGSFTYSNAGGTGVGQIIPYDATHFRIIMVYNDGSSTAQRGAVGSNFGALTSAMAVTYDFEAPIAGWSSNVQMSDQSGDNRTIAARAVIATGASTAANTPFNFSTVQYDTTSSITTGTSNWKFTAPAPGFYRVSTTLYYGATTANIVVYKNGAFFGQVNDSIANTAAGGGSTSVNLNAGDYIFIGTSSGTVTPSFGSVSIERIGGNSQTAIGESVNATYGLTAAQSVAANGVFKYDTKVIDTHNAYSTTTGLFTAPVSGIYQFSTISTHNSAGASTHLTVNGTVRGYFGTEPGSGYVYSGSITYRLNAGDTAGVYGPASALTAQASDASGGFTNQVSITKVGN